ncbi:MAG: TrmH family RNA methyltransferase [Pseudomonadota bacterium]
MTSRRMLALVEAETDAAISLAVVEPDMAPNLGAILRLGACLGAPVHVVEPCGFAFSPKMWARSAMDYADLATIHRHDNWAQFAGAMAGRRLVALSTRGETALWSYRFAPGDVLMLGSESRGLPDNAMAEAGARLAIPLRRGARSLNIGMAGAIALAEAQRQVLT